MIKKKICLLGAFAVGKTSLISQFINQSFSEKYHTTIGVKIDQKNLTVDGIDITLLIWDIHGEDRFQKVQASYLFGSSGCFYVADATRKESLPAIIKLKELVEKTVGDVPYKVLINKSDLIDMFEIGINDIKELGIPEENIIKTSAKTGEGVENAFSELSKAMIENNK
jgi:small GTP-binding protein